MKTIIRDLLGVILCFVCVGVLLFQLRPRIWRLAECVRAQNIYLPIVPYVCPFLRPNWNPPPPTTSPASECVPPGTRGCKHSGERVGVPIRTTGKKPSILSTVLYGLERLTAHAEGANVPGSMPAFSETVESRGRQMKQC